MRPVWLQNLTGATILKGRVVKPDPANDNAVVLTGLSEIDPIGVAYRDIPTGTWGPIVVGGVCDVYVDNAGAVNREDWIGTSGSTLGAVTASALPSPPTAAVHFQECGHILQGGIGPGLYRAAIHFN